MTIISRRQGLLLAAAAALVTPATLSNSDAHRMDPTLFFGSGGPDGSPSPTGGKLISAQEAAWQGSPRTRETEEAIRRVQEQMDNAWKTTVGEAQFSQQGRRQFTMAEPSAASAESEEQDQDGGPSLSVGPVSKQVSEDVSETEEFTEEEEPAAASEIAALLQELIKRKRTINALTAP